MRTLSAVDQGERMPVVVTVMPGPAVIGRGANRPAGASYAHTRSDARAGFERSVVGVEVGGMV